MQNKEQWLDSIKRNYEQDKEQTLENLLIQTVGSIEQYIDKKDSLAAKAVLISCLESNLLFFKEVLKVE